MWFKDADDAIIADLIERGLMYRHERYEHTYPHNWRDDTPLMYFARETWFINTLEYKRQMIDLNQTINWVPHHLKDGRFGNWLEDLKEWSLGRERYWGTPLPVWVDDETGEMICVGGVDELRELTGDDLDDLDLHRPYVDDIASPNPSGEGGTMRRVPEVIDVWFDSGAMQVAQWAYPQKNRDILEEQHPADYICEAVDQTRGWFYSLHAIGAMLFETVAFKNVISLGHLLDEHGQKMSTSKGNVVDPWEVLERSRRRRFPLVCLHLWSARRAAPLLQEPGQRSHQEVLVDAVEHLQLLRDLRQHRRLDAKHGRAAAARARFARSLAAGGIAQLDPGGHRRLREL